MKQFLILTFLFSILIACGGNSDSSDTPEETGKVMESDFLDTCQCNILEIDTLGNHFRDAELYTGICLDFYPETDLKYIEKNLLNGRLHGIVTYFSKDGEILIEEIYEDGNKKRDGAVDIITCECSELEEEETHIPQVPFRYLLDDIPYTGKCESYFPDSHQIYMSKNYKEGVLDGYTLYYTQDGSTNLIEKYENGILISAIH